MSLVVVQKNDAAASIVFIGLPFPPKVRPIAQIWAPPHLYLKSISVASR
jgi:hypothetical protein